MTHRVLLTVVCVLISYRLAAHPGGLGDRGGHSNRRTGEYHCNKAPCKEIHRQVEAATQEAIKESCPVSFVCGCEDLRHWIDADRHGMRHYYNRR